MLASVVNSWIYPAYRVVHEGAAIELALKTVTCHASGLGLKAVSCHAIRAKSVSGMGASEGREVKVKAIYFVLIVMLPALKSRLFIRSKAKASPSSA